jgi:hypothetical protein
VHQIKDPLFFPAPSNLLNFGVQMIMPSLAALFTDTARKMFGNKCPLLRAIFIDQMKDHSILFLSPWAFNEAWIQDFLPSVQTLNVSAFQGALRQSFSNFFLHVSSLRLPSADPMKEIRKNVLLGKEGLLIYYI